MTDKQNTAETQRITAPLAGIWRRTVPPDSAVAAGDVIGYVEAIKLDAAVTAPAAGVIHYLIKEDFVDVEGGDIVAELRSCA